MEYIEDWVDRAMSCFYRDRDKGDPGNKNHDVIFPTIPLDPAKVDKDFEVLVKELGLSEEKQQEMYDYSLEKKMSLLVSQHCVHTDDSTHFINFLSNLKQSFVIDSNTIRQLQDLVISLRTQSFSYLETFISQSGLLLLTDLLNNCHLQYSLEQPALFFLYALRALLNSPNGRSAVLLQNDQHVLVSIARSIDFRDFKCKIVAIEILSGLCFIPEEGHTQVLKAITQVSQLLGERTRFQTLVSDLHRHYSTDRDTDRVRTAILGLINALLRTGPAENCAIYRQHLRCELLLLGMSTAVDVSRHGASTRLEDHIDLFDMMRKEDEISLAGTSTTGSLPDSGSSSPIDFESTVGMAEALQAKLKHSHALPHFHSLLQHLFMVPVDEQHVPLWRLFDLILQHLTLQTTVSGITDVHSPVQNSVDMNEILARLQNHCDYERILKELEKTREEMDHERTRTIELENRLADFSDVRASTGSRISLASTSASSSPSDPCPSPPLLPPVCPPAPPPPPPPIGMAAPKDAPKNVPEPPSNMKTLNWQRITMDKSKGTIWEGMEDEKMYNQLDLTDLVTCFAASSSHRDEDGERESIYGTINRRPQTANVTVIDARRYQNCTIMLSKLKLSHKEIKQAMMTMDEKGKLPKDMIEQMLKFVPTKEELGLINDAAMKNGSVTVLAPADRYMYEISTIPRFEQRLRCLHIIRTFRDRVDALLPLIQGVIKASTAMQTNKRFRQFLSIVLSVGNYLNYGKRNGNAYGFELSSLNKLGDVKNAMRNDRNLMHWLIGFVEKKYPDLTRLKKDLEVVYEAARFSQAETGAEIRALEEALLAVRKELNMIETKEELPTPTEVDKFAQVAKQFIGSATSEYHSLDKQFKEMKTKFTDCSKYFCFLNPPPPEEFFSMIAKFLTMFSEYHQQLWAEVEEEEKAKKQTIARTFLAKKSTTRRKDNHKERDFESLISALQSGDIFKEELSRLRTSFRPKKTIKS